MLASNGTAKKLLREAAGPDLRNMISLEVKDLGVDSTLGPLRRVTTQRKRLGLIAGTARRIAQVPLGWRGRLTLCTSLLTYVAQWGSDITGIPVKLIQNLRSWSMYAITGGTTARRAPEATFALVAPRSWLDPDLYLIANVIGGWIKKVVQKPDLIDEVPPAWEKEVKHPSPPGRPLGPISPL
eukprot:3128967-Heterocapsa_arctica.AAC.1